MRCVGVCVEGGKKLGIGGKKSIRTVFNLLFFPPLRKVVSVTHSFAHSLDTLLFSPL